MSMGCRMNEHSYIRNVHKELSSKVFKWKIRDSYAGGVPDAYYSGEKGCVWAEYKHIKTLPQRDTSIIKNTLSSLQKAWLNRAMDHGQHAILIYGFENKAAVFKDKTWEFTAITKKELVSKFISRKQLVEYLENLCLPT